MKQHAILLGAILLGLASVLSYAQAPLGSQSPSSTVQQNTSSKSHATFGGLQPHGQSPILNQQAELAASDGWAGNSLGGWGVAIDKDTAVAGGLGWTGTGSGVAYVFVKSPSGWADMSQTAKLTTSDGSPIGDVAVSGNTVVGSGTSGRAYVFVEAAGGWADMTETARLTASNGDSLTAVAISGNTIVAAAASGVVYVFVKPLTGWANMTETAKLSTSNGDYLTGVAMSSNTVVAGADGHNNFQGAAYVFAEPPSGWANMTQTAELTASDGADDDFLGCGVGVSGDTVVAGAPNHTINGNAWQGALYVFVKPAGGWADMTQTAELTASDGGYTDQLGNDAAINGDTVVGGAPQYEPFGNTGNGKAYAFFKPVGGWTNMTESVRLEATDGAQCDALGVSVAINSGTVAAGAPGICAGGGSSGNPGAAYVFGVCSSAFGVTLCPSALTFATQLVGTSSNPQPMTLTNTGSAALNIISIVASTNFGQRNNCGSSLAAGASCIINVTFRPRRSGTLTGTISVSDNAPSSPQTASLTGVGTVVTLLPASLDFGDQPVGTTSQPQTVTFTNYGKSTVSTLDIGLTGTNPKAFAQTNGCGTGLPAGESCTITITFSPKKQGAATATLNVVDNGGGSPQTVTLSGNGG